jgi:hypothetical protein
MDRCSSQVLLLLSIVGLACAFTACVGKSGPTSNNGTVVSVTLNPAATLSIDLGATQGFSATARNSLGQTLVVGIEFFSSNTAALNIAANGAACAGTWDPTVTICTPGASGVAQVTAVANGVSSPPTTVYVHEHIGSITVARIGNPNPDNGCFAQGQSWDYQATAFSTNGVDITATVGPMSWVAANATVLTVDFNVNGLQLNQVQVTARNPGITQLFASVSGVTSNPLDKPYISCLVGSIMLQLSGSPGNSVNINAGGSETIQATVLDTLGNTVKSPPLTWNTTNPEVATVSNGTVSARQNLGGADITASCTPPTCNIGVLPGLPVYANKGKLPNGQTAWGVISVNVTASKPPTYTAWAATTDCGANLNCTSTMFSVTPGANPIVAAATVPFTPNSLMFTPQGARAYMGSPMGLMFLDLGGPNPAVNTVSSATTPCNVAICGKVLAISPDGNRVVVADTVTQPNQVYIYDNSNPAKVADLLISGGIAAAFSPDEMKFFILTNSGTMYVSSKVDALASFSVAGTAADVALSADGSFAYVAGTPGALSVSGFATCNLANVFNNATLSATPLAIRPLPDLRISPSGELAESVLALDPPNVDIFTVTSVQNPLTENPPGQFFCQAPTVTVDSMDFPPQSFDLGQGNFTPLLMQVAGNGTQVIVVAKNVPAVLVLDLNAGTTTAIPLANNPTPLAAAASTDGSQVFVAACDGIHPDHPDTCNSVHLVNTLAGGDIQEVVFTNTNTSDSMCNNLPGIPCLPNLIAIKPQ